MVRPPPHPCLVAPPSLTLTPPHGARHLSTNRQRRTRTTSSSSTRRASAVSWRRWASTWRCVPWLGGGRVCTYVRVWVNGHVNKGVGVRCMLISKPHRNAHDRASLLWGAVRRRVGGWVFVGGVRMWLGFGEPSTYVANDRHDIIRYRTSKSRGSSRTPTRRARRRTVRIDTSMCVVGPTRSPHGCVCAYVPVRIPPTIPTTPSHLSLPLCKTASTEFDEEEDEDGAFRVFRNKCWMRLRA